MISGYINFKMMDKVPNKYNLKPSDISKLKVKDWDKVKKNSSLNKAMTPPIWCHYEETQKGQEYMDEDSFWIGFKDNGSVEYRFSSRGGMCHYNFKSFYKMSEIENDIDMELHMITLRYLNKLLDEDAVELRRGTKNV